MGYSVPQSLTLNRPIRQNLDVASSTAMHELGTQVISTDGRRFTYSFLSTNMTATGIAGYPAQFLGAANGHTVTTTITASDVGASFAGIFTMNIKAGSNYVWIQDGGYVPSACASCTAGALLYPAATGRLSELPTGAISTSAAGVTYELARQKAVAIGLQTHSGQLADVVLVDR